MRLAIACTMLGFGLAMAAPPRGTLIDLDKLAAVRPEELIADSAHRLGSGRASTKIVMFGDLTCSACAADYIKFRDLILQNPEVALYYRHVPSPLHRGSRKIALDSERYAAVGAFWRYVDHRFEEWSDLRLDSGAKNIGTELPQQVERLPAASLARGRKRVDDDIDLADQLGVRGTPIFVLVVEGEAPRVIPFPDLLQYLKDIRHDR